MDPFLEPSYVATELPVGSEEYLRLDHPRLVELRERYDAFRRFHHTHWAPEVLKHQLNLAYFRGDNAFTWQVRGGIQEFQYVISAYHCLSIDRLNLFDRLPEDGLFGCYCFDFNGRYVVSRDLLDSVIQMNFLDRHMGLSTITGASVLDIGAGYGRLALRMTQGLTNLKNVWCTDAVPESTFICEFYLRFRGAPNYAEVLELDRVESVIRGKKLDLVTNVQSFTECAIDSIRWWLEVLAGAEVRYLLIVPNHPNHLWSLEPDGSRIDFEPLLEQYGYQRVARESVYEGASSAIKLGVYPHVTMWLFSRQG